MTAARLGVSTGREIRKLSSFHSHLFKLCVYGYCMHVCMYACVPVDTHGVHVFFGCGGQRTTSLVIPQVLSTFFLKTGCFIEPRAS